jgi:hypothetical protein
MEKPNIWDYFESGAKMHKTNVEETDEFKKMVERHDNHLKELLEKDYMEEFNQNYFFP